MTELPEPRRILVVEDEALIAMLLEDALTELGYTVVGPLSRLQQALEAVEQESFDAALLDVNLDGREVYPVAEALQARGIPFAFSTGYDSRGLRAPWDTWPTMVQKPFRQDNLARVLDALFGGP